VRAVVNYRVCELAKRLSLIVVTICKSPINPITNPNPVSSRYILHRIRLLQIEPRGVGKIAAHDSRAKISIFFSTVRDLHFRSLRFKLLMLLIL
jgi:hypothetical protein